jgi:predicted AlkP superfamily phosphohydrolase/phosphomutase
MRILVIGLDCAAPELLLHDQKLTTLRALMQGGCYGRLESVVPPITVPAWMCMVTGQDPGSLGVYGFRNRRDYSYDALDIVNARSFTAPMIWDVLPRTDAVATVGVPPSYPPRAVNGVCVGCFLTPDTRRPFTYPPERSEEFNELVGGYPVDVAGFRTDDKAWLRDEIYAMSQKHFRLVRHLLQERQWSYFHFVEIGLDRMHHGFWHFHDPEHRHYPGADNPFADTVRQYYRYLDEEIASVLDLVSDDTIVLVVSDHGAQRLDGGFCVNEWLMREGLLVLRTAPQAVTPFSRLDVDWDRTTAWSEGGYYARVFLNVKGREPRGTIGPADYGRVRDEVRARLEATLDDTGRLMGTRVFYPDEIYRTVRNVAPDLIAHFGGLFWRSIGSVGHGAIHVQENDTGPDSCNHAQYGAFVLSAPNLTARGEIEGAHLLDIAPTLLDLAGHEVPSSLHGRVLSRKSVAAAAV